jgi:DNA-binding response OmpR family regulator
MPKVLVVDDEPAILEVLQTFLIRNGHTVRTVCDGPAAIQSVRADRPDVVLLDLRMPGMSGLEVLRCIREIDHELRVLILSGVLDEETRQQVLDLGAHACLPKPVDPRVLERFLTGAT